MAVVSLRVSLPWSSTGSPYGLPDSLQNVRFPPQLSLIEAERQRHVTRKLLGHLERGVLVRANREGISSRGCARAVCSGAGMGGLGPHYSPGGPCKLERDAVVRFLTTGRFFQALQLYQEGQLPAPDPMVTLCFGEELHDLSTAKSKLIIVQYTAVISLDH
ncbi:hypothetical protein J4Q44_G00352900 [Coregonus suidteri]|uniref:Interferon regulatory factor-3 domain-containing protein n=1 Tax=Coregonus suidteri TaxID=861788 RepID=A0AAN8KYR5_9TELE